LPDVDGRQLVIKIKTSESLDAIILEGAVEAELPFPLTDPDKYLGFSDGTLLRLSRTTKEPPGLSIWVEASGSGVIRRRDFDNDKSTPDVVLLFGVVNWCLCGEKLCFAKSGR
jgi:hypothetical protein